VVLRNEPIMAVERGEAFRLPTYARLSRRDLGQDEKRVLYRAAGAPFAQATLCERRRGAYVLRPGESPTWKPTAIANTIRLGPRETRLLLTDKRIDTHDTTPPRLEAVVPKPARHSNDSYDLGYLRETAIAVTLRDANGVARIVPTLVGERGGVVKVRVEPEAGAGGGANARVEFGLLPEDEYVLTVRVSDALGNDARYAIAFQTIGITTPFTAMNIVASSGRLSKQIESLHTQFYRSEKPGDFITYEFTVPESGRYEVRVVFTQAPSYGKWQFSIDGRRMGHEVDGYANQVVPLGGHVRLGAVSLTRGAHRFRVEVAGRNPKTTGCFIGLGRLILRPRVAVEVPK